MATPYGFRKVKSFTKIPANTLISLDPLYGVGSYTYLEVTNVDYKDDLTLTVNVNPDLGHTGTAIPISFDQPVTSVPMMVTNFIANGVVTVVAYGA